MPSPDFPNRLQQGVKTTASVHNPAMVSPGTGFELGDIYFILFRHKWKILLCAVLGVVAAAAYYKLRPPPYQSEAKLFIRYVMDSRTTGPSRDDTRVKALDTQGESIISSELEIISSLDLAAEVVDAIGPEKLVQGRIAQADLRNAAISTLAGSLTAEAAPHSSVIHITFKHWNPAVVQPALREIIDRYLKKHVEIHRALGITGDFLTQETDRLRARLALTQEELSKAQNKIGIASIEDAKKSSGEQIAKLKQDIAQAEREYSERSIILRELTGKTAVSAQGDKITEAPPAAQLDEYRRVTDRLVVLQRQEQELLTQYTEETSPVKNLRAQLEEVRAAKLKMENENPALKNAGNFVSTTPRAASTGTAFDPNSEMARLKALESSIKTLRAQLEDSRQEAEKITQMEATIQELRRKKELEEANYKYYSASLEQARIDEALGAGHVSNISEIQSPSVPFRNRAKSVKTAGMLAVGGILAGLAWAFAIEKLFDRTVKRPIDVERLAKVPLFISIPLVTNRDVRKFAKQNPLLLGGPSKEEAGANGKNGSKPSVQLQKTTAKENPLAPNGVLYPFHETLRDRLIAYFESINLTHKPKLVAVTGVSPDSGVTTVAAGLAQRLSETGEGNVLLVDMTGGQGSAQQFFKGQACALDDVFSARESALMQDNLYVVTEGSNSEKLSRNLPQRFTKLVPKLKASDFDYIIFDMPPVSQISVTPRLAGFMDMVLLVIESEKTDKDVMERASALLGQSTKNVGVVLNKTRSYIPKQLFQGSLGDY